MKQGVNWEAGCLFWSFLAARALTYSTGVSNQYNLLYAAPSIVILTGPRICGNTTSNYLSTWSGMK
jgi:hypothetical protein